MPELKGMLPRSFDQIFEHINAASSGAEFLVRASFLEIYNDNVLDLLAEGKEGLDLKEDPDKGVYVKDLRECSVKSVAEINALAVLGRKSRKVGSTLMNRDSSRSHCLFCIKVETSELGADGENHIRAGKLNMVDLAGSERQGKTGAEGDRLKEAAKINLALSALGNVISALTSAKKVGHVVRTKMNKAGATKLGKKHLVCVVFAAHSHALTFLFFFLRSFLSALS